MEMIKEHMCDTVVIGLPKKLDGTDSIQTEKVYEFKERLENKLRSSGMGHIQIVYQDERLTTIESERILMESGVRREHRKEYVDKMAAAIILQSYLDANRQ